MKEWLEKHDVLWRVVAVLIAVVLWIYVVNVVDPTGELSVRNVHPTFIGAEELLNAHNLIVANEDDITVDVKLTGSRRELSAVNTSDVRVEVDISQIKQEGDYSLSYKVILPNGNVSVIKRIPDELSIKVDKIVTKTVPIKVELKGNIADGYMAGDITTVPSTLSVIGKAEEMARISHAQITIGKKDLNTTISEQMEYVFCDVNGKVLELQSVSTESSTVEVSYPVLKMKKLPLSVEISEGGGALAKNVDYKITPAEITIAGDEKTVDSLSELTISVLDLAKLSGDTTFPVKVTLPENVKNISGVSEAELSVTFSGLSRKSINTTAIEIVNIPRGYTIEPITQSLPVMLRGTEESLSTVMPQNVRAVVDLDGTVLSPGQHTVSANVVLDGVSDVGAVGEYKVIVSVSK